MSKRKYDEQMEHNNKKQKIEWRHVYDLSDNIINHIFIFLGNDCRVYTLQYVSKLFLNCARKFIQKNSLITIKDDKLLNIIMKIKFKKINIDGSHIDNDLLNKIIDNLTFVEILGITNCNMFDINLNKLSKLKELSLKNCNNLKGDFINSLLEIQTFDGIIIEQCRTILSKDLFNLVIRPFKKLIINLDDFDNDLSYLDYVNLSQLEVIRIGSYTDKYNVVYLRNFFKNLHTNNSLQSLKVDFYRYPSRTNYDELLSYTSHLKLKYLSINNARYKNMGSFALNCNFELLETLILHNVFIKTDYLIQILNNTSILKELKIEFENTYADITLDINVVLKEVKQIKTLTDLHLEYLNINNTGLQYLTKFNLKNLSIQHGYRLENDCLKYIKDIKLHSLDLLACGYHITDDSLIHLKDMSSLNNLSLKCTHISDNGLIHLKDLPLTSLNLEYTNISGNLEKYKQLFKDSVNIVLLPLSFAR
jgi:hypothetical protein